MSSEVWIEVEKIQLPRHYIRASVHEGFWHRLSREIEEYGRSFEPIVVRPIGDGKYEVIDGVHRFNAYVKAGKKMVPCIVHEVDEVEAIVEAYRINKARNNLSSSDTVRAFYILVKEMKLPAELAVEKLKLHPVAKSRILALYSSRPDLLEKVAKGELSLRRALELAGRPVEKKKPTPIVEGKDFSKMSLEELVEELERVKGLLIVVTAPIEKRIYDNVELWKSFGEHLTTAIQSIDEMVKITREAASSQEKRDKGSEKGERKGNKRGKTSSNTR